MDFWEVLLDSTLDTLKIFPFLLAIYILIAFIERKINVKKHARVLGGKCAPLVGAAVGVIPLCGFSVTAVKLFEERCITIGTLLAIFISTSDEAVTVLVANGMWKEFLLLATVQMVAGIVVGYCAEAICGKGDLLFADETDGEFSCCHHHGEGKLHDYFVHPLLHCLKTLLFVFLVNLALGVILALVGEEPFAEFMDSALYLQPVVAGLVGLIPNCGASTAIVSVFVGGNLSFGGLVAGITANAGVGFALLFKEKKYLVRNLVFLTVMYAVAVIVGELVLIVGALI